VEEGGGGKIIEQNFLVFSELSNGTYDSKPRRKMSLSGEKGI